MIVDTAMVNNFIYPSERKRELDIGLTNVVAGSQNTETNRNSI